MSHAVFFTKKTQYDNTVIIEVLKCICAMNLDTFVYKMLF